MSYVGIGVGYPVMITNAVQQSAVSTAEGAPMSMAPEQFTQEALLPTVPAAQNMVSAVPFFNLMIPLADNFGGPVNVNVSPSFDPSGADLPISGKSTTASLF